MNSVTQSSTFNISSSSPLNTYLLHWVQSETITITHYILKYHYHFIFSNFFGGKPHSLGRAPNDVQIVWNPRWRHESDLLPLITHELKVFIENSYAVTTFCVRLNCLNWAEHSLAGTNVRRLPHCWNIVARLAVRF